MAAPSTGLVGVARGRRWRNTAVGVIVFMTGAVGGVVLTGPAVVADRRAWGLLRPVELPRPVVVVVAIVGLEAAFYWLHRAEHRYPLLWRIHRAHHTDLDVDVTTALRSHPIDLSVSNATLGVTAMLLGAPPALVGAHGLVGLGAAFVQHSRVAIPPVVDRTLDRVLVTPSLHAMHHSTDQAETDSNFGGLLIVFDRFFGTSVRWSVGTSFGLDLEDIDDRQTVRSMLLEPFRPGSRTRFPYRPDRGDPSGPPAANHGRAPATRIGC